MDRDSRYLPFESTSRTLNRSRYPTMPSAIRSTSIERPYFRKIPLQRAESMDERSASPREWNPRRLSRAVHRINLSGRTFGVEPSGPRRRPLSRGRPLAFSEVAVAVQIKLVGERQADVCTEFVYRGQQPECHPCLLNAARARVVEVVPLPPACSVAAGTAVEGAVLAYEKIVCADAACPNFRTCHPIGIEPGTRIRIVDVGRELECPLGYSIVPANVVYTD